MGNYALGSLFKARLYKGDSIFSSCEYTWRENKWFRNRISETKELLAFNNTLSSVYTKTLRKNISLTSRLPALQNRKSYFNSSKSQEAGSYSDLLLEDQKTVAKVQQKLELMAIKSAPAKLKGILKICANRSLLGLLIAEFILITTIISLSLAAYILNFFIFSMHPLFQIRRDKRKRRPR